MGSTGCLKCSTEIGTKYTSPGGSASCTSCLADAYMLEGECKLKPKGVVTKEDGTTLETLELEEGWFRFSEFSTEIYPCPR